MTAKKVRRRRSRASFSKWEIGSQSNGTGRTGISGSHKYKYKFKIKFKYKYKYKYRYQMSDWITEQWDRTDGH